MPNRVADIVDGIFRLHHGTEGDGLDEFLLVLALAVVHQIVQAACRFTFGAGGFELVTELDDELAQCFRFLRVWIVVDTIRQRLCLRALLHFAHALGHGAVGGNMNSSIGLLASFNV